MASTDGSNSGNSGVVFTLGTDSSPHLSRSIIFEFGAQPTNVNGGSILYHLKSQTSHHTANVMGPTLVLNKDVLSL